MGAIYGSINRSQLRIKQPNDFALSSLHLLSTLPRKHITSMLIKKNHSLLPTTAKVQNIRFKYHTFALNMSIIVSDNGEELEEHMQDFFQIISRQQRLSIRVLQNPKRKTRRMHS